MQKLCWDYLPIRTAPRLHTSLSSSSNINTVEWLVSVYACCAIVRWFCSHHFLWLSL